MIISRTLMMTALFASLTACIDESDDSLSDTESNLSVSGWYTGNPYDYPSGALGTENAFGAPPSLAILNGVKYWVYPWADGASFSAKDLYYSKCDPTCSGPIRIPNERSASRANVATFNNKIYMVHMGEDGGTGVWFSTFDPATGGWPQDDSELGFQTYGGPPVLAAFNNQLYMVGSKQVGNTYPLWYATMDTNGTWSDEHLIQPDPNGPVDESVSSPSIATLDGVLYIAHRWGQTSEIVLQKMSASYGWQPVQHIPAGDGTNLQGNDVQLAAVNGYLHLVHHRFNDDSHYWWTYNRGCDAFATEMTVPQFTKTSESALSVQPNQLILSGLEDETVPGLTNNYLHQTYFTAPATPIRPPSCSIGGVGGIGGIGIGR